MQQTFSDKLSALQRLDLPKLLHGKKIGLEKECLRVNEKGTISTTPHPAVLGSALTNPYITTDYSEALLELITSPMDSAAEALQFLQDTQNFVYQNLQDEILWNTSMPCVLTGEDSIRIAEYGHSNAGIMKTVYRRGLGHRYGKMMQVIAGIHYNYSLPYSFWQQYQEIIKDSSPLSDFISEQYMQLTRNLQRYGWLIPYLFGASPAVCRSFMDGIEKILEPFDDYTYHHPYATSLRLSDIGYQNYKEGKSGIKANYDSLPSYIDSLRRAIETPSPAYEKIGLIKNGEYQQLNTNLLQIENEYYSTVRPKQITGKYEKPTVALSKRGIAYIELRSLDVNVLEPMGISENQLNFLEVLMLFCLFHESPLIDKTEQKGIDSNQSATAHHGREPGLTLNRNGSPVLLSAWAKELFERMADISQILDTDREDRPYQTALNFYLESIRNPDLTPSARILAEMIENEEPFFPFSMRHAQQFAEHFKTLPLSDAKKQIFEKAAAQSISDQQQLEADNNMEFGEFLNRYFAETLDKPDDLL